MAKFKSKGFILKFGAANPPTVTVGQCGDGSLNLGEREAAIDVTTHDNTTGTTELLDNGFKTPFSSEHELMWDPADAQHEAIRAALESGATMYAQYVVPDTGLAAFTGAVRVKAFSIPAPARNAAQSQFLIAQALPFSRRLSWWLDAVKRQLNCNLPPSAGPA